MTLKKFQILNGDWGDWGLGIGALGFGPNPQTPNPQTPTPNPKQAF